LSSWAVGALGFRSPYSFASCMSLNLTVKTPDLKQQVYCTTRCKCVLRNVPCNGFVFMSLVVGLFYVWLSRFQNRAFVNSHRLTFVISYSGLSKNQDSLHTRVKSGSIMCIESWFDVGAVTTSCWMLPAVCKPDIVDHSLHDVYCLLWTLQLLVFKVPFVWGC
jgi:hypothetical protein